MNYTVNYRATTTARNMAEMQEPRNFESASEDDSGGSECCCSSDSLSFTQPYRFEPEISSESSDEEENNQHDCEDERKTDFENRPTCSRMNSLEWCSCGRCVNMGTVRENVCCQQIEKIRLKTMELNTTCISDHPDFEAVCLHPAVLETAYFQYRQYYDTDDSSKRQDEKYRHTAYRQLFRWCFQYLGREVRRVLPACAVNKIRTTFPSPDGNYRGFSYI